MGLYDQIFAEETAEPARADGGVAQPSLGDALFSEVPADAGRGTGLTRGDPKRAARVLTLGQESGLAPETVDANLDAFDAASTARQGAAEADRVRQTSPTVASWLAEHPSHATVAQDDLSVLERIERLGTSLRRGYRLGVRQTEQAFLGYEAQQRGGQIPPDLLRRLDDVGRAIAETPAGLTWWEDWVQANATLVGQQVVLLQEALPQATAGLATGAAIGGMGGGPFLPVTAASGGVAGLGFGLGAGYLTASNRLTTGDLYLRVSALRDESGAPIPEDVKQATAVVGGLLNAGLELAGGAIIAAPFKVAAKTWMMQDLAALAGQTATRQALLAFGTSYATVVAGETTEEVLQEVISTVGEEWAKAHAEGEFEATWHDPEARAAFWERLIETAGQTIKGTTLFAIPGATLHGGAVALRAKAARAQRASEALTDLGAAVKDSQTAARAPDQVEAVIQRIADRHGEDGHVYLSPEAWDTYYQTQREDPRAAAEALFGSAAAYDEAKQGGHDLAIPLGTYAVKIAPTAAHAAFAPDLRVAPDELTVREAEAELATAETAQQTETLRQLIDPVEQLRTSLADQLARTGVYTPENARVMATTLVAVFRTQAARTGRPIEDLIARYAPRIRGPIVRPTGPKAPRGQFRMTEAATDPAASLPTSLVDVVREAGGILPDQETMRGEARAFSLREGGGNLLNRTTGQTFDRLREAAVARGAVPEDMTLADFITALRDDVQARAQRKVGVHLVPDTITEPDFSTMPRHEVLVADLDLRPGDSFAIAGERFTVKGHDEDGNLVIQDGETFVIDEVFGQIPAPDEGRIKRRFGRRTFQQARQPGDDAPRGSITFSDSEPPELRLFQAADLSTFLHESGHLYATLLRDLALEAEASQQVRDDWAAVMAWVGSTDGVLTTEQHEQFARGFEAYLMEGRSPSVALRTVFARMKAWLLALYRSVRSLHVELTPEIRGVMDRLVASDDEIAASARAMGQEAALFATAEQAGMTEVQFATYRKTAESASHAAREALAQRMMAGWQREHSAWWRDRRRDVMAEVAEEVNERPGYRALSILQRGVMPDGSALPDGMGPIKLDTATLKATVTKAQMAAMPIGTHVSEGGVVPDAAAMVLGFGSGDELVTTLLTQRPRSQVIEEETARRMQTRYGDKLLDPDVLRDAAQAAVANEHREDVLHAELKALITKRRAVTPFVRAATRQAEQAAKATAKAAKAGAKEATRAGVRQVTAAWPLAAIRQWAARIIAGTRVRRINPGLHLAVVARESAAAVKAAATDDFAGAALHKRNELMNLALYRESSAAQERVDRIVTYLRSFRKRSTRERIGKAGQAYLQQIDALLDRFDLAPISQTELARRESLAAFVLAQSEEALPLDLPEYVLNEAFRTSYLNLTYEELVGLHDAAKQIAHLAGFKNQLMKIQAGRTLDEAAEWAARTIRERTHRIPQAVLGVRLPQAEARRMLGGFLAENRKLASLIRELDGGEDGGPLWTLLMRPINEATHQETDRNAQAVTALRALYAGLDWSGMYRPTWLPGLGANLSHMERIAVGLNWGNEENRWRVLHDPVRRWDSVQVAAILNTLTREDWTFIQGVWDYFETFWPEIAALQERVRGVRPEKVQALSVETGFGTFRGGYFPLVYESRFPGRAERFDLVRDIEHELRGATLTASTRHGHRETRIKELDRAVRLDLNVIPTHVNAVIHDLTHFEMLLDVNRLLRHPDVESAIKTAYGDIVYDQFRSVVRDLALGRLPAAASAFTNRSLEWLRDGVTIAALGLNATTAAIQPLGLTSSMVRIGPKWVASGLLRWLGGAEAMETTVQSVAARSPMMRHRWQTMNAALADLYRSQSPTAAWRTTAEKFFFYFIVKMQVVADMPTWLGAYEKAMAGEGRTADQAIAMADQAVEDAQGSGSIKDLPAVMRSTPAIRLFTNFMTYLNATFNLTAESYRRTDFRAPQSVGLFAVDLLLLYTVPTLLMTLLRGLLRGDEADDEEWTTRIVQDQLAAPFSTLPLVRELTGAIQGFRGYEGPAGTRFFVELGRTAQQLGQGDLDLDLAKALNRSAGILFHYPSLQLERTVEGWRALQEGETDRLSALIFGPPKEANR